MAYLPSDASALFVLGLAALLAALGLGGAAFWGLCRLLCRVRETVRTRRAGCRVRVCRCP